MPSSLALILMCGALVGVGFYLILERSLSRVIIGLSCLSNGVNILFLIAGGRAGNPPVTGSFPQKTWADPLVMAMMLTSIVITLSTTSFMLAMAYRTWQLRDNDRVRDDIEDRAVAARAASLEEDARAESGTGVDEVAAHFHDETDREPLPSKRGASDERVSRRDFYRNPSATLGEDGRR